MAGAVSLSRSYLGILLLFIGVLVAIVLIPRPADSEDESEVSGRSGGHWFKGNTHAHSLWSDGNDFPDMIASWYKERGYHFLVLSDHNILSRGEKWMALDEVRKRQKVEGPDALQKYLEEFGEEWVEVRGEEGKKEVRLKTLEEVRSKLQSDDYLLVEGEEITDRFRNHQIHINAVNLGELVPPQKGASVVETVRNNLRAVEEQAKRLNRPILTHLNHPNFHYSFTARQLAEIVEEQFFEVYNGHPGVNQMGDEQHAGVEELWDLANAIRMNEFQAPPLYGVATDDSHYYHGGDVSPGRGWVMVWGKKLGPGELVEAMKRGDFYASTGIELEDFSFRKGVHALKIKPVDGVTYTTRFVGTRKGDGAQPGEVFAAVGGLEPAYTMTGDELYVRAVVTSSEDHGNPSYKGQKLQAWTQPVF